jgi:hypothetical protein
MRVIITFISLFSYISQSMSHSTIEETFKTCVSSATIKEGHLHMTSLSQTNQRQRCHVKLSRGSTVFLELERYNGRDYDKNSWTNITAIGKPNVTISINDNFILTNGEKINVLTHSKLEKSMWLRITYLYNHIEIHFAPISDSPDNMVDFGHLTTLEHQTSAYIIISSSTTSGMEQVLRSIGTTLKKTDNKISLKTIHEIERRIKNVELEMKNIILQTQEAKISQNNALNKYEERINDFIKKKDESSFFSTFLYAGIVIIIIVFLYWQLKPRKRYRLD